MIDLQLETGFSCAHFYSIREWSDEENQANFGKCYSKEGHGHGHDYLLEVKVTFPVADLVLTEERLRQTLSAIKEEFDHRHLNLDFDYFRVKIPTCENLSQLMIMRLQQQSPTLKVLSLRLYEKADLAVQWVK